METPIAFFIFKRPDTTRRVFDTIRQAKPKQLFVIADGPRKNQDLEAEKCEQARKVVENIDWDCEVFKNFSNENMGCARRVSTGLDWVFQQVDEAIILEDDCVPDPSFFPYCEELLGKYKYDSRIMSITGQNVQFGRKTTDYSYYFSRYSYCWGWATWKRAWNYFDFEMSKWPEIKQKELLKNVLDNSESANRWQNIFEDTVNGKKDSWSYRWTFACFIQSGMSIVPNTNLVSNIGFGNNSTNTKAVKSKHANLSTIPVSLPLLHPPYVMRDLQADLFAQKTLYQKSKLRKFKDTIKQTVRTFS